MKSLYETFEEKEFAELKKLKESLKCKSWKEFILKMFDFCKSSKEFKI